MTTTHPKRKAGSLWVCSDEECTSQVITQPGTEMLGRKCGRKNCRGTLEYRGGRFVYEYELEFKVISDYYLVDDYIRQNRQPLDREKFKPRNRVRRNS